MAFAGFGRCCLVGIVLLAFLGFGAYQASTLSDNNVFRTWQSNVTNFVYGAWNASAAAAAAAASAPLLFKSRSDLNAQVFCPRMYIFSPLLCVSCRRSKSAGFSVRHIFSSALCFLSSFKIRRFSVRRHFFPLLCVSCRRSKSAGSLSGISFPTICVVGRPRGDFGVCSRYLDDDSVVFTHFECAADWNDRFPTLSLSSA
jgi:hypothetical protein